MIKAVLFDFDETLQDRTLAFESYMDSFFEDFMPNISNDEKEKRREDMVNYGNGGYVNRVEYYSKLVSLWGWKDAPSAEFLANHYDTRFGDHNKIFPNTIPLLKKLKEKGLLLGVITNGPSYLQNHKMDESGLRPYMDIVIVSGDLGVHKPNKEIFEITARELGLNCSECVYVGDHPVNDIEGALGAGMKAIRMNYGWFKDEGLRSDVPNINDIIEVSEYV